MSGRVLPDDLTSVAERMRWVLACRVAASVGVPGLGFAVSAPGQVLIRITGCMIAWLAVTAVLWIVTRGHRGLGVSAMTVSLLGDGVVLAAAWEWLGGRAGPVGGVIVLHVMAVTLVASFRTGLKMALWHSLLALFVLDLHATGLLSPRQAFPVRDASVYLAGLWTAVIVTAALAAVNERELRRRRYDEKVLRDLALTAVKADDPAEVAGALARFAINELEGRRAAVVVQSDGALTPRLGGAGVAARASATERGRDRHFATTISLPRLTPDEVTLIHEPHPVTDAWLVEALPGATDVAVLPFGAAQVRGVLVVEYGGRRARRGGRKNKRRLVNTGRQAAAQSAAAAGRAVALAILAEAAHTDGLTGLVNRARFDVLLADAVARQTPLGIVLIDLDHFKGVNDTYGHQVGDEVLRGVAAALRAAAGTADVVARYGGEELVVIGDVGSVSAAHLAERLRHAVATAGTPVSVTASIGVAMYPMDGTTPSSLLEAADRRLYIAKRSGRNRVVADPVQALTGHNAVVDGDVR